MGESSFRQMVGCVLLFLFPVSLFAADSNAAMLYTSGAAWVNGAHVPRASSAIFSGDLLQTHTDTIAKINEPGSSITVLAESLVKFGGSSVEIEHGGVTVATSKGVATNVGGYKISPSALSWTEFNVTDVDGTVRIAARKGDVTITDGKDVVTLAQGQETTREETTTETDQDGKHKKKKREPGASPGAQGGWLDSNIAVGVGLGAGAAITALVLIKSDNPASPSKPN